MNYGALCYLEGKSPTHTLNWKSGCNTYNDTKTRLGTLPVSGGKFLPDNVIMSVVISYRQHLRKTLIHIMGDKLVLFKPVNMQSKYITLLLVSQPLRRKFFSHYHTGPSGGHMGYYKTLFRLRLRCWSTMREEIKEWVKR